MTKSFLHRSIFVKIVTLMLLSVFLVSPLQAFAQTLEPPQIITPEGELSLSALGYEEQILHGPFDQFTTRFGLPIDWELIPGSQIELDLAFYYEYETAEVTNTELVSGALFGGLLQVVYNNQQIATLLLENRGDQSFTVDIPAEALLSPRDDARHEFELVLISEEGCLFGIDTIVVVRPTTRFVLPHKTVAISTELAKLPQPIYQASSVVPNQAVLVVPNSPTNTELNAANAVMAGFGRMTDGELTLSLLTESQLTTLEREQAHLIFVGKPAGFAALANVDLPVDAFNLSADGLAATDGVVAIGISPWNAGKAVLLVSGDSDEGVLKAAKAVSAGSLIGIGQPDVALIQDTNPSIPATIVSADRTFLDLGYQTDTINRFGIVQREFSFYIPPGQRASGEPYLDLYFAHSDLVQYDRSGLVVQLNGESVGSVAFTEETARGWYVQVALPTSLFRTGQNDILLEVGLVPRDVCAEFYNDNLWIMIDSKSKLHIPLLPSLSTTEARFLGLDYYPEIFALSPQAGSVAFVVPQADSTAWQVAAQLAFDMGNQTDWTVAEFETYYSADLPQDALQTHDLILVGRASQFDLLADLGAALPAPFSGGDLPTLDKMQVEYRLPDAADVGFLELLAAPQNPTRAILAVLGSSDLGLISAGSALILPELRGALAGDLALISGSDVIATDTRANTATRQTTIPVLPAPETDAAEAGADQPVLISDQPARPTWVLPVVGGIVALMLAIVLIAGVSSLRRRNS